jgi:preprotein translocase subunit Sec61beta
MSKNKNVNMPRSGAGVTQFNEISNSKFRLKPISVVVLIVLVVFIVISLHLFSPVL